MPILIFWGTICRIELVVLLHVIENPEFILYIWGSCFEKIANICLPPQFYDGIVASMHMFLCFRSDTAAVRKAVMHNHLIICMSQPYCMQFKLRMFSRLRKCLKMYSRLYEYWGHIKMKMLRLTFVNYIHHTIHFLQHVEVSTRDITSWFFFRKADVLYCYESLKLQHIQG